LKNELEKLYYQENLTKKIYASQIDKFDGKILITLKYLNQQEEMHSRTIKMLLDKINFDFVEKEDFLDYLRKKHPLIDALNYDVQLEETTQTLYEKAINKSTDENMKKLLTIILEQEYDHLQRLNNFVEENK
jgi:rubrerythrin